MKSSQLIPLPFTPDSFVRLLQCGAHPGESPYGHKQIAEWCDTFWCHKLEVEGPPEIDAILPILTDVETQWDLFLANTFSLEELRSNSFEEVQMPVEWFTDWLNQVLKLESQNGGLNA
jgi:hypothetical protein